MSFDFSAGELCLHFCNAWAGQRKPEDDAVQAYEHLLCWAGEAGLLDADEAEGLRATATENPGALVEVIVRVAKLRDAIFSCFARIAEGRYPTEADFSVLNRELAQAMPQLRLKGGDEACCWEWSVPHGALDCVLWPVVRSAAELLTSAQVSRVRQCASEDCSWLFLDTSRNGRRRWCDMSSCGNRAKAKRYYARHRKKQIGRG